MSPSIKSLACLHRVRPSVLPILLVAMQLTELVMLTLSLVFGALATPTPDTIVDMVVTDTTSHKRSLEKRFSNAQMTFFEDGFGQLCVYSFVCWRSSQTSSSCSGACGEIIDGSQFVR